MRRWSQVTYATLLLLCSGCRCSPPDVRVKLIGLMQDANAHRPTVAIFRDSASNVFAVREGDLVVDRYRLTRVMADAVAMTDSRHRPCKIVLPLTGDDHSQRIESVSRAVNAEAASYFASFR